MIGIPSAVMIPGIPSLITSVPITLMMMILTAVVIMLLLLHHHLLLLNEWIVVTHQWRLHQHLLMLLLQHHHLLLLLEVDWHGDGPLMGSFFPSVVIPVPLMVPLMLSIPVMVISVSAVVTAVVVCHNSDSSMFILHDNRPAE